MLLYYTSLTVKKAYTSNMHSVFKNQTFLQAFHRGNTPLNTVPVLAATAPSRRRGGRGSKRAKKALHGLKHPPISHRVEDSSSGSDYDSEDEEELMKLTAKKDRGSGSRKPKAEELMAIIQESKSLTPKQLLYKCYEKGGTRYLDNLGYLVRFLKDKRGKFKRVNEETKDFIELISRPRVPIQIRLQALRKKLDFFHKNVFPKLNDQGNDVDTSGKGQQQKKKQIKPEPMSEESGSSEDDDEEEGGVHTNCDNAAEEESDYTSEENN